MIKIKDMWRLKEKILKLNENGFDALVCDTEDKIKIEEIKEQGENDTTLQNG